MQGILEENPLWAIDRSIFAGEVEAEQKEAIKALLDIYGVTVPKPADVTITSGYPLETIDRSTLIQFLTIDRMARECGIPLKGTFRF